ncbi:hypothetical protein, partial [Planktothrix sp.]|uniref:hypothetical protein n=1 Tax=Planktothrix sp. TaxID=3088171 RepID=UPI0038D3D874
MNSLQLELDKINQQLELLTYRKQQLDSIMAEYSDVVNRVKNLVDLMNDAMVEPSNLLTEIEGIIFNVQPELTPIEHLINEQSEQQPEEQEPTTEYFDFDLRLFPKEPQPEATLNALGLPVQTEAEPEPKPEHMKRYYNNIYWDNGSSVRVFIPKKRRYKGELEAIINDCISQGLVERFEINECGEDWIIQLSPVTSEDTVKRIIGEFYPIHTDGEPEPTPESKTSNPELLKLMALVPVVSTPTPAPTKTQLNERAYRRNDTLLIGFDNKRLMIAWAKWFNESFNGAVFVKDDEQLEGFKYCLSVLWYGSDISTNWERLSNLNYSFKPDEQPTGIKLDDVRNIILKLQSNGLKFISKGELLAHHLNSLKASDLENYLEKLAEEGLIILGNKSIDLLPTKTQDNEPKNPTFEYTEVDEKTTKVYNNG